MGWVIDIPRPAGPSAAPGCWPYRQHRTMAVVMRHEALAELNRGEFECEENPVVIERLNRAEAHRNNRAFVLALAEARSARP